MRDGIDIIVGKKKKKVMGNVSESYGVILSIYCSNVFYIHVSHCQKDIHF